MNKLLENNVDLNTLTKEELVAIVKEEMQKLSSSSISDSKTSSKPMDFSKYKYNHIALKFCYLGFDYHGFARQVTTSNTVEEQLFQALRRIKLVNEDEPIQNWNYSRCGRTDKGVSAMGQVVALKIRSNEKVDDSSDSKKAATDYIQRINSALPDTIRVLAWATVPENFSARFSCLYRTYKYFFPKKNYNIEKMREAAAYFIGDHDFRNFCKLDIDNVTNFRRKMLYISIEPSNLLHQAKEGYAENTVYEFIVCGYSFLWHQIRCMIAILFLVGESLEQPQIVKDMLDIQKYPSRPNYEMASEFPLLLFDCGFEDIQWKYTQTLDAYDMLGSHFMKMWEHNLYKNCIINSMFFSVADAPLPLQDYRSVVKQDGDYATWRQLKNTVVVKRKGPKYVSIEKRPRGPVIDASKKRKHGEMSKDEFDD